MTVTGKYDISLKTPLGIFKSILELEADGAELKGRLINPQAVNEFTGKASGQEFEFTAKVTTPIASVTATVKGKVEDDKLIAQARIPIGTVDIEGCRVL